MGNKFSPIYSLARLIAFLGHIIPNLFSSLPVPCLSPASLPSSRRTIGLLLHLINYTVPLTPKDQAFPALFKLFFHVLLSTFSVVYSPPLFLSTLYFSTLCYLFWNYMVTKRQISMIFAKDVSYGLLFFFSILQCQKRIVKD